jgi:redox-sensing transcriptional repressor
MADRIKIQNSPSVLRMPSYLHKLMHMHANGEDTASAAKLAEYMDLDTIIVRKDFDLTGITGRPGVGYRTKELIAAIRKFLGWDITCEACLVGAGSLGSALLGHEEFMEYGMYISELTCKAIHYSAYSVGYTACK